MEMDIANILFDINVALGILILILILAYFILTKEE